MSAPRAESAGFIRIGGTAPRRVDWFIMSALERRRDIAADPPVPRFGLTGPRPGSRVLASHSSAFGRLRSEACRCAVQARNPRRFAVQLLPQAPATRNHNSINHSFLPRRRPNSPESVRAVTGRKSQMPLACEGQHPAHENTEPPLLSPHTSRPHSSGETDDHRHGQLSCLGHTQPS